MKNGVLNTLYGRVVAVLDQPNRNGRIYSKELAQKEILSDPIVKEQLAAHSMFGMFNPTHEQLLVDTHKISHCITDLYIEDNLLKADIDILDTPEGKILNAYLNSGGNIRLVLFGQGKLTGNLVTDYTLNHIDAISVISDKEN